MRISAFLLFCGLVTANAAVTYSQSTKVTVDLENCTIDQVLNEIEDQSEFYFLLNQDLIDINREVSITAEEKSIKEVLDEVFEGTDVRFMVNDRQIILYPESIKESGIVVQQLFIRGTVTDAETGEVLPGVSIFIKGTSTGTMTNMDGQYTLNIPSPDIVLVFSFIGYKTQEVSLAGKQIIDVALQVETTILDEVIVVGYGVQKKSDLTGAIVSIKSDDLQNRSTTSVAKSLQGKTAGLTFVNTAGSAPGSTPTIHIRGFSSNFSSNPLYVVDGLRTSSISYLDPNDIESIEILKDAASAAIYGQEAGNGVILVTTRKGKVGEGKLTYDFQYTFDQISRVPEVMNSRQYCTWLLEGGGTTEAALNDLIQYGAWNGQSTTDWAEVAFETGITQRHNLSFMGGSKEGNYYMSLSYLNSDGMTVGNNDFYSRITGTLNADREIRKWLRIGSNNNVELYSYRNVLNTGTNTYNSLFAGVINLDPTFSPIYPADALPDYMQAVLDAGEYPLMGNDQGYYGWSALQTIEQYNPLISTNTSHAENTGFALRGSTFIDLTPVKGLIYTSRLSYSLSSSDTYSYGYEYYANTNSYVNQHSVSRAESNTVFYQWENYANYTRTFDAHTFNLMGGMSYQESRYKSISGKVSDVVEDDWYMWGSLGNKTSEATVETSDSDSRSRRISYFGQFNYNYGDKYLLRGILRADAADLAFLPMANRWGFFPSLSAGWTISNEDFFNKNERFNFLKLRVSWGQNGSLGSLGGYAYASSISYNTFGYTFDVAGPDDAPAYYRSSYQANIVNDELQWETSEQVDIALDARFLKDRLSLTLDWYSKKTKDLIISGTELPIAVGNSSAPINAGNVSNSGLEIELGWQHRIREFAYSAKANMATLHNEVTYMDPSVTRLSGSSFFTFGTISAFEIGHPVWYFYGYEYAGVDEATGDPLFYNASGEIVTGNDLDAEADKTEIGGGLPDLTFGLTLNCSWKGFDFTVFGSGAAGNEIFSCLGYSMYHNQLVEYFDGRWIPGADNSNARYPRAGCNNLDKYSTSTALVYKGAYFKIKQIQLGYTMPKQYTSKLNISSLRIYGSLDDWFTFTSYPGLDPEASSNSFSGMGLDFGSYPNARKTMIGISVTF